jgi:hypothetical protein
MKLKHNINDFIMIEGYSQGIYSLNYVEYYVSNPEIINILRNLTTEQKLEITSCEFNIDNPGKISTVNDYNIDIQTIICPIKELGKIDKNAIYDYYKQFNSDKSFNYPIVTIDNDNIIV